LALSTIGGPVAGPPSAVPQGPTIWFAIEGGAAEARWAAKRHQPHT
jgi:hypothetical protein